MVRRTLTALLIALSLLVLPRVKATAHAAYWTVQDSYAAISQASHRWHVNYYWLLRVATCESGLEPWAYNPSGASGVFQEMPGTFYSYARVIGEYRSIWNPYANANVAGYLFSRGMSYLWVCNG